MERKKASDKNLDRIETLYLMLERNFPLDKIADWLAINSLKYSNQLVTRTFRQAGREDLREYFIKEEDLGIKSIVKSRMTGRIGKVTEIKPDGHTVVVQWDSGGSGPVSKESLFKLRNKDVDTITDIKDITKPFEDLDPYGDLNGR